MYVLVICDEEIIMFGVCYFIENVLFKLDYCIIGEFISLVLICVYKGYVVNVICVTGKFGYLFNLVLGVNVIEIMYEVLFVFM